MARISAHLVPFAVVLSVFVVAGAVAGFFMGSVSVGAFFGAALGVLVFVGRLTRREP